MKVLPIAPDAAPAKNKTADRGMQCNSASGRRVRRYRKGGASGSSGVLGVAGAAARVVAVVGGIWTPTLLFLPVYCALFIIVDALDPVDKRAGTLTVAKLPKSTWRRCFASSACVGT